MSGLIHRISQILQDEGVDHAVYSGKILVEGGGEKGIGIVVEVVEPYLRIIGLTDRQADPGLALSLLKICFDKPGVKYAVDPDGYVSAIVEQPLSTLEPRVLVEGIATVREEARRLLAFRGGEP